MFDGGIPVNTIDVAVVRMSAMILQVVAIRNEKIRAPRVGNSYITHGNKYCRHGGRTTTPDLLGSLLYPGTVIMDYKLGFKVRQTIFQ